jgi:hypothetical protein
MAFACVLPGPSGDDSHPGVRVWPYRHPSLCGGVNNGDVSATAVSLCRLQQALKRDPQVHLTTHLNALFGQFVEQQVAARRWEFSGRPWRPDNGSCRSSPLPPDTPRKPHGAAFIRLTPLRLRGVRLAIDCLNCHPIEIEPHVECDRAIARRVQAALRDARA